MAVVIATLPATPPRLMRALAVGAALAQGAIAVTGSVVRVTGSGLGCRDWPPCFPGSLVPDPRYDVALLHQWVEFGNRLLTVLVSMVAVVCWVAALRMRPRRRRVTLLAATMPAGVAAQAVIGGITVLAGLAWWTVSVHFLVSMLLVWLGVLLVCATRVEDGPAVPPLPVSARRMIAACAGVLIAVLVAGTTVTAAGPHAGDATTPRLAAGVPRMAQLHAELVATYVGLLIGLGFLLHAVAAARPVVVRYRVLVAATLAQAVLGVVQYELAVPEVLVSLHVLGAVVVTAAAAAVWAASDPRRSVASEASLAGVDEPRRAA
jgi:cytochrome c oxidase assembly protein subunit 15